MESDSALIALKFKKNPVYTHEIPVMKATTTVRSLEESNRRCYRSEFP